MPLELDLACDLAVASGSGEHPEPRRGSSAAARPGVPGLRWASLHSVDSPLRLVLL